MGKNLLYWGYTPGHVVWDYWKLEILFLKDMEPYNVLFCYLINETQIICNDFPAIPNLGAVILICTSFSKGFWFERFCCKVINFACCEIQSSSFYYNSLSLLSHHWLLWYSVVPLLTRSVISKTHARNSNLKLARENMNISWTKSEADPNQ